MRLIGARCLFEVRLSICVKLRCLELGAVTLSAEPMLMASRELLSGSLTVLVNVFALLETTALPVLASLGFLPISEVLIDVIVLVLFEGDRLVTVFLTGV